jgi:beta-galactosidase GanA
VDNLTAEVVAMARLPRNRYGLLYQTSEGVYAISDPDGLTGSAANRYVISTTQLRELMWEMGIRVDQLDDQTTAAKLAALVAECR